MPTGIPKREDPSEEMDQIAEIAHQKQLKKLLDRMPKRWTETHEGHDLVGTVRRIVSSRLAG